MKRWITIVTTAALLGMASSACADFPVTTQSSQSNTGRTRPLFGRGGVIFPWLGGGGGPAPAMRRNPQRSGFGLATSKANARGTKDATNVLPDLGSMFGRRR